MADGDRIQRQHRYTITPEHLILDPDVDDRAFRLWCRLDRYAGDNGAAFPFRETLSVELDCSLSSIDRAIEKLVDAGWLTKERMAAGDRNAYTLLVVPEKTVLARIKAARKEREAKWTGQRRRKPSVQAAGKGVVTGDDRWGVVTDDDRLSSSTTTGVVTGDAHKEATTSENQGRSTAAAGAPTGRLTAVVVASTGTTTGKEVDLFGGVVDAEVIEDEPDAPGADAESRSPVQTLVAAYVDVVTANGGHCTGSMRKSIGSHVKRILRDDNIPPEVLLVAIQKAAARGSRAIDETLASPDGPQARWNRSPAARKAMHESWLAMGRKLDEAASQRAQGGAA